VPEDHRAPPKGLVSDRIAVTLNRWEWFYFLGWLEAMRPVDGKTIQLSRVAEAIAEAVSG
jgi:hypothetical protein